MLSLSKIREESREDKGQKEGQKEGKIVRNCSTMRARVRDLSNGRAAFYKCTLERNTSGHN